MAKPAFAFMYAPLSNGNFDETDMERLSRVRNSPFVCRRVGEPRNRAPPKRLAKCDRANGMKAERRRIGKRKVVDRVRNHQPANGRAS